MRYPGRAAAQGGAGGAGGLSIDFYSGNAFMLILAEDYFIIQIVKIYI